jgi:hypothetical protein
VRSAQSCELPRERRREIGNAIRAGRAVNDPRDAALAVAWAEYLDKRRYTWLWPRWVMPRERPVGRHAWFWSLHVVTMLVAIGLACVYAWKVIPSPWHWLVVAWVVYSVATLPFTLSRILRFYWNASQAAAANRRLLSTGFPHARSTGAP